MQIISLYILGGGKQQWKNKVMLLNAFRESRGNVEKWFEMFAQFYYRDRFLPLQEMLKAIVQLNCKAGWILF